MTNQNRNYPTRMHEVLGVEAGQLFSIYDFADDEFFLNIHGRVMLKVPSGSCPASGEIISHAINHGITRRPQLSEEQVAQLRALLVFGMRWLASDKDYYPPFAYQTKPKKEDEGWYSNDVKFDHIISVPRNASICDLVSWSDPEPLDIVATLKAAGVEVE